MILGENILDKKERIYDMKQNDLNKRIYNLFSRLNFDASLTGYRYMKIAVLLCLEDENRICNVWNLYREIGDIPYIASKASSVERCIRHLAKRTVEARENEDNKLLYEIFGDILLTEKRITNKRFIAEIVEYLRIADSFSDT